MTVQSKFSILIWTHQSIFLRGSCIMKKLLTFFIVFIIAFTINTNSYADDSTLNSELSDIRYQVTAIEHIYSENDKKLKIQEYEKLIKRADNLIQKFPNRAEPYIWKGICLSAQAKHKGIGALSNVKNAKYHLEASLYMDPSASDAAASNALGMLYYKVPPFPISFRDNEKAEEYFKQALSISSNLDTNYRYGEFLLKQGRKEEGIKHLTKALSFPDRAGRKEDVLKKEEIKNLLDKYRD